MEKRNKGISTLFWLYKQRSQSGKYPIYLRITLNQKRAEISTQHFASELQWDQKLQGVGRKSDDAEFINGQLAIMKGEVLQHYHKLSVLRKPVTAEAIKNAYLGIEDTHKTLKQLFTFYIKRFSEKVKIGKKALNSLKCLKSTEAKVFDFLKYRFRRTDILLSDIQVSFPSDLEHYLVTVDKVSNNTAMKYIKIVKRLLKAAVQQGWMENNPLAGFRCPYEEPQRERLTMMEILKLQNTEINSNRLAEVRDIFLFSCFTGFAYQDVANLSRDNIIIGIDGEIWIVKEREKTNHPEPVPLLPMALEIVEKYKLHPYCTNYNRLLPVNSNQKYNAYLKEVTKLCGINKHLTSHTARHTFATTITLEHDVPIETVSQMLGHKSIRTTQLYAKITQVKISNNMKALKEKLKVNVPSQQVDTDQTLAFI